MTTGSNSSVLEIAGEFVSGVLKSYKVDSTDWIVTQ